MTRACLFPLLLLVACNSRQPVESDSPAALEATISRHLEAMAYPSRQGDYATTYAPTEARLSDASAQGEFALSLLHHRFQIPPMPTKLRIVVFPEEIFVTLFENAREKGIISFTVASTIVVCQTEDRIRGLDAICHESIHAFLAATMHPPPPLWLEEGLAVLWGQRFAEELHTNRGQLVTARAIPAFRKEFEQVTTFTQYPQEPEALQAFHLHCASLVAYMEESIGGPSAMPDFVRAVSASPESWREYKNLGKKR